MSRSLGSLGRMARLALQENGSKRQMSDASPKLFAREAPVDRSATWMAKNPYIEAQVWRRDHMEREFTWNVRNTVEAIWFIGGFSAGLYALATFCLRQTDERSGYPRRDILGSDTKRFVLPDEREFY